MCPVVAVPRYTGRFGRREAQRGPPGRLGRRHPGGIGVEGGGHHLVVGQPGLEQEAPAVPPARATPPRQDTAGAWRWYGE